MLEVDPQVWKDLLAISQCDNYVLACIIRELNPDAKKFYLQPIPKFDKLEVIFGKD